MEYTAEDIRLYHILLEASVDGRCHKIPVGITQRDVDRFVKLEWCGIAAHKVIVLAYNELTFSELEKQFYHQKDQQAAQEAQRAEERAYLHQQTKEHFRHDWRITIVGCAINFAVGAILDHFFDIVTYATNLWRSLFP